MLSHYLPIYKHVIVASVIINIIGVAGSLFTMNVYDRVVPNNATATTVGADLRHPAGPTSVIFCCATCAGILWTWPGATPTW